MKIILSPGYGAGWSSWHREYDQKLLLTWPPLITAIENKEIITEDHSAITSLKEEISKRTEQNPDRIYLYLDGLGKAVIEEVSGNFRINEYDGYESIMPNYGEEWIKAD